jgi:hypothetical protein
VIFGFSLEQAKILKTLHGLKLCSVYLAIFFGFSYKQEFFVQMKFLLGDVEKRI